MALFLCFKWKSIWHPFSVGHNGLCKYHKSFCCKIIHRMLIWKMIHLLSLVFIGTTVQQFHIVWHFKPPWHHQTNKQFSSFSSAICSLQSLYLSFSMRNAGNAVVHFLSLWAISAFCGGNLMHCLREQIHQLTYRHTIQFSRSGEWV